MNRQLSRQRQWQLRHPTEAALLKQQTVIRRRYRLSQQGYVKTYEELYDIVLGYEKRNGRLTDAAWWDVFEYLDWKYNGSKFTDLNFSKWLATL